MHCKDPSGFHDALGLARSAALEGIWVANRSPYHAPSVDDSEEGITETSRNAFEASVVLSASDSKGDHGAFARQLADTPKTSSGGEDGAEWSRGENIAGEFVSELIAEILFAPFSNG